MLQLSTFVAKPRRTLIRLLAAGLMGAALPAAVTAAADDTVLKMGLLTSFGGNQIGGKMVVAAAQMAIDDFGGSVLGKKIELLTGDEQYKPDVALSVARQWMDEEKLNVMVANTISASTFALVDLAKKNKIPLLLTGPGSEDLTGKSCSEFSSNYIWNVYSLPRAVINGMSQEGAKTWYILTIDNAYGKSLENNAAEFIAAAGGKVLGVSRFPLTMQDYSAFILRAQASKADVIALGTTGDNTVSIIKQANEFGVLAGGQKLAALSMNIQDVHAIGLNQAKGLRMVSPFYHDMNDETRAWNKRFLKYSDNKIPTLIESGVYSAVTHYLTAVKAAGTTDGSAVMAKIRSVPVNDFQMKNVMRRDDGQMMRPMYLLEVKSPAESKEPWDYYKVVRNVPASEAWRPAAESQCNLLKK
ncbi:MAG: ABC transporter substrate-binding protein [Rhodoferax sp.]|nr:ABC transporter substrate-binding protein [Rhodoferax sp.]